MAPLGMMYPARGGLVFGQMRKCYLKSGVYGSTRPREVCITYSFRQRLVMPRTRLRSDRLASLVTAFKRQLETSLYDYNTLCLRKTRCRTFCDNFIDC